MAKQITADDFSCPIEITLSIISGKWKGMILYQLAKGASRFNQLRRLLPGVTQRMLTLQLRELENSGVIRRVVYSEMPPKVEYSLTEFGDSLKPILELMEHWGEQYREVLAGRNKSELIIRHE